MLFVAEVARELFVGIQVITWPLVSVWTRMLFAVPSGVANSRKYHFPSGRSHTS